jgi:siroheme synthase
MGLANIREIASRMIAHGRAPWTPILAVSKGTLSDQRELISTLGTIADDVERASLPSPALFIIGEVVELRQALGAQSNDETRQRLASAP